MQWLAIGLGAAFGACLRAWLSRFNTGQYGFGGYQLSGHWIPLGTLAANVLGGFLIGLALVIFERFSSHLPDTLRLFVITGFLGGLTTFSSFSAEVFDLLNAGRLWAGLTLIGLHVGLTLLATAVGYYLLKTFV